MITKAKQLLATEVTLDHESMLQRIKELSEVVKMQNDWIERAKETLIDCKSLRRGWIDRTGMHTNGPDRVDIEMGRLILKVQDVG